MYGYGGMGSGWMVVMMLLAVTLSVGLVLVAVLVATRMNHGGQTLPRGSSAAVSRAHSIVDERFARGEIDEDEHRSRRAALDDRGA